jgi:formate-nitrite transporter family protein
MGKNLGDRAGSRAARALRSSAERSSAERGPLDEALHARLHTSVEEGARRLHRTWPSLLATGIVGGVDIGFGVLGLLLVRNATGSQLLGALAFGIGFIALSLADSELFTENFFLPVVALVGRRGTVYDLARLWTGTLISNLFGGWLFMGMVVIAFPALHQTVTAVGSHEPRLGIGAAAFAAAVLAGALMTLMTWMEQGTDSVAARLVAAVATAFLLGAGPLNHVIVSSLEAFAALQVGASFGYLDWLGAMAFAGLGNLVGGIGLVTLLRLVQAGGRAVSMVRE